MPAKKLTKAESAWLDELEALLMRAPKRFEAYTIGDNDLTFYDVNVYRAFEEANAAECRGNSTFGDVPVLAINSGAKLRTVRASFGIVGGCG